MSMFFIALNVLMALVVVYDATRYIIPNWISGLLIALWPLMFFLTPAPVDWLMHLAVMGGVFVLGFLIFAMRWMGGGDIKLLTACALWVGLKALPDFLLLTAVFGGLVALVLIVVRQALVWFVPGRVHTGQLPRILHARGPVPYGLAIAGAFVYLLWHQKLPGLVLG